MGETTNICRCLLGKLLEKWLLGGLRRQWEDTITHAMNHKDIWCEKVIWIEFTEFANRSVTL
jgi:hypothetical protein